ncbi:MAG: hypothetical protein DRP86_03785 [Candidatus Neomarinimicrobiota bacterium]|nr:MAG: hypothetical protein DRP86_03785 [Candidatus Neomarinimicrobiota bacterium]
MMVIISAALFIIFIYVSVLNSFNRNYHIFQQKNVMCDKSRELLHRYKNTFKYNMIMILFNLLIVNKDKEAGFPASL